MQKVCFFSIIIPTYNRAHMLSKALDSVCNQSFTDWECIVVDDGSTDNTKELLRQWADKDNRFRYIYQENAERSAARNNGINNAKGEYICFLDSDDEYLDSHLSVFYSFIKKNNSPKALLFTNYIELKNNEKNKIEIPKLCEPIIQYLLFHAIIPARVCVHNEILKKIKFDEDIVIAEDAVLWMKIANEFPVFQIEEATVEYNLHEENSINLKNDAALKRFKGLKVFFHRYSCFKSKISKSQVNRVFSDTCFDIAKHYIYHDKKSKAMMFILKSMYYKPIHFQNKHKIYCLLKLLIGKRPVEYI
jgi:glycosyltransferase involved in cell wall biosynthesis